jgi:hypothetical protein
VLGVTGRVREIPGIGVGSRVRKVSVATDRILLGRVSDGGVLSGSVCGSRVLPVGVFADREDSEMNVLGGSVLGGSVPGGVLGGVLGGSVPGGVLGGSVPGRSVPGGVGARRVRRLGDLSRIRRTG